MLFKNDSTILIIMQTSMNDKSNSGVACQ